MYTYKFKNQLSWKAFGLKTAVVLCLTFVFMPLGNSQESMHEPSNSSAFGSSHNIITESAPSARKHNTSSAVEPSQSTFPPSLLSSAPVRLHAPDMTQASAPAVVSSVNDCNRLLQLVEERMYDPVVMTKLVTLAAQSQCPLDKSVTGQVDYVNSLIAKVSGDPYTYAINPDDARAQNASFAGTTSLYKAGVGGIGVGFRYDPRLRVNGSDKFDGHIWRVYPNSPASGAGITDSDVISQVDGHDVIGQDASFVQDSLRGALNSFVSITVMREGSAVNFVFTRRDVQTYNVFVRDVGDGYFAILVDDFTSQQTPDRIREAIASTFSRAKGYIIDIRNNGGGLIDSGVGAAELFIRDGLIISDRERRFTDNATTDPAKVSFIRHTWTVDQKLTFRQTDDAGKETSVTNYNRQPFSVEGKPVVVLINGNTASASEIFTSSVKGNRRIGDGAQGATIVGDPSFGKGIGQINDFGPDGTKVRVTYLRYYTTNGVWLGNGHDEKHPLMPDLIVTNDKDAMAYSAEDKQLQEGINELRREIYKNWQAHRAPVSSASTVSVALQAPVKQ